MFSFPAAPFILAFILGGMMEQALRQTLTISNGSLSIFWDKPIALTLIGISLLTILVPLFTNKRKLTSASPEQQKNIS
jgi:putative tricarboxylic transport membrane protein